MKKSNFNADIKLSDAVISIIEEEGNQPRVVYRMAGSDCILLEYGDMTLDLNLRVRLYSLRKAVNLMNIEGILELTPGLRSILIHYDGLKLSLNRLIEILKSIEKTLPDSNDVEIPSRRVHLPISLHDRWSKEAMLKYMNSIRETGPYLPDNVEFIARANDLSGIDEVKKYFLSTEYLVIGLGDVYLGAPCAVPLDPRYRMVVPKYNPARTWTAEGTVGLGGAFLCIYPMESPGGYQLVGRTLPIWNTWQTNKAFEEAPWLLRFFDRIKFKEVSEEELEEMRNKVKLNQYEFEIEEDTFNIKEYNKFLDSVKDESEAFRHRREKALQDAIIGY